MGEIYKIIIIICSKVVPSTFNIVQFINEIFCYLSIKTKNDLLLLQYNIGAIVKKYLYKQIIIETKDELMFTNSQ